VPFPTKRNGSSFVGQRAFNWRAAVSGEAGVAAGDGGEGVEGEGEIETETEWSCKVSPVQCRRSPAWLKG
jgi:hypothetical protein